jgi:toluene monooxygenase system protein A
MTLETSPPYLRRGAAPTHPAAFAACTDGVIGDKTAGVVSMALLKREEWYDLGRETSWTPRYVPETDLFPESFSGALDLSPETWETWAEPQRMSFREYVEAQRESDAGAYSVKAAATRGHYLDQASPGWRSVLKAHYGAFALPGYQASLAQARMARFSRAPGHRNLALLAMLDGIRHGQIQLHFAHELCPRDRQFDWAWKALHTEGWGPIAIRQLFDDLMMTRSASETAVMLTFALETGFASLQFQTLATDAARAGDSSFSTLISSVQADEARHAQQGAATLRLLIDQGKREYAQQMVDIIFWRSWRLYCLVTGQAMDYYTPLSNRTRSFKEFVLEFVVDPFVRAVEGLGLQKPWYWDHFLATVDTYQHGMHLFVWYWRQTLWWNPRAGVSPEERDWLESKYPGWNDSFGRCWDAIIENGLTAQGDKLSPTTWPVLCNLCGLPIVGAAGAGWAGGEGPRTYSLDHLNRRYSFCSEECRWIFGVDSDRYQGHLGFIDRLLRRQPPPDVDGASSAMAIAPGEQGQDAEGLRWFDRYRE